jgi:hypothetical protein
MIAAGEPQFDGTCKRLTEIALQSVKADSTIEGARRAMIESVKADRSLYEESLNCLFWHGVTEFIYDARHGIRRLLGFEALDGTLERGAEVQTAAARTLVGPLILEIYMVGDKALGDCTREDLEVSADRHHERGIGELVAERFQRMVAARLKAGQVVRNILTAEQAMRLLARANGKVERGGALI